MTPLTTTGNPRRRSGRSAVVAGVAGVALVLGACSGDGGDDDTTGGAEGEGEGGGTEVTIALPEEPRTLASWNAYSNDGHPVLRNVTEALLNRDPETNELVPELATAWEQVDDTNWQFTLREGVTFHDGTEFTAETAAAGLNYVLDPENAFPMRTFLGPDVTASAVDEYTLNVETEAADPILPTRLYFVTIPSPTQLEEDLDAYETTPIGTGPYRLESWSRGQSIVLAANEDWWGLEADDAMGEQQISQATYVFRPETEVRSGMLTSGEADLAPRITSEQCEAAPACQSTPTVETVVLRLDTPHPMLADQRIREAIALSIDKEQIMNDILGGGEVVGQIVGPGAVGYAELEPYPYDPERATELVAEAAADGVDVTAPLAITARDGFILRANEAVQIIASEMQAIGLTGATSSTLETAAFEEQWTIGYDNIPEDRGWVGLQQHGQELMDYAGSVGGYYSCDGQTSAYCDETLEEMYAAAVTTTEEERQQSLAEIAEYVYEEVPVVPIGQPNFNFGLRERIDWTPRMDGFILLKEMTVTD